MKFFMSDHWVQKSCLSSAAILTNIVKLSLADQ